MTGVFRLAVGSGEIAASRAFGRLTFGNVVTSILANSCMAALVAGNSLRREYLLDRTG
jgi:hypothetical protein